MFPSKRARHNRNPDSLIDHGTSAQSIRAETTEHLSGDAPPRQPGTMPHRTLTREFLRRLGSLALVPVVVAVLGAILVSPAVATSQDMDARQVLLPPSPAAGSPQLAVLPTQAIQPGQAGDQPPDIPTGADVYLELAPADATIWLGDNQTYIATAIIQVGPNQANAANNPDTSTERLNVTRWTDFSITRRGRPSGICNGATCMPATVGKHIVAGAFS